MAEDVSIHIGFKVLTEELEKATNLLERMANALRQVQASSAVVTPEMKGMGAASSLVSTQLKGVLPSVQDLVKWFNVTEEEAQAARTILEKAVTVPKDTPVFKREMFALGNILHTDMDTIERFTNSLRGHGRTVSALDLEYKKFRDTIKAQRVAVGAQLYSFSQLTYQFYWLGIGIMFTSMSFARLLQRQQTAANQTFSLAKAYQTVTEAQKALNQAIFEGGYGSEQHRQAAGRLKEAEYALQLQMEQTRLAVTMEYLGYAQLVFGMFPVMINAFILGTRLYGFLASARAENIGLMTVETEQLGGLAGAQLGATGAAMVHQGAEEGLANSLWETALAALTSKATLWGLATMGIGTAVAIGIAVGAMKMAEKQIESLKEQAKKLSKEFMGATESTTSFGRSLGPHSVAGSARAAKKEIIDLYNSIRPLQEMQGIEVTPIMGIGTRGNVNVSVNISFPNTIVRSADDIEKIGKTVKREIVDAIVARGRLV